MKLNIQSKDDLIIRKNHFLNNAGSYIDRKCREAAWCRGYAAAMQDILDSWDEIYQAHRLESAIEDAKSHLQDYIEPDDIYESVIHSGIPGIIAERFLDSHDCDVAENDQFESIIEQFLKENDLYQNECEG